MILLDVALWAAIAVIGIPALLSSVYLLVLTLLSWRLQVPRALDSTLRFDVIVPAHNESVGIARTLHSLGAINWPKDRFRIVVIADNCSDNTAAIARTLGVHVLERSSEEQRGKGYALSFAFEQSRLDTWADAVVVVDADSEVSINLLSALAAQIDHGAAAVQVHYGVLNPSASWRTRLMTIATAAIHIVRSRARERLGLSCGIRGNGWCVTHALLRQLPYRAFSLTEDVEYGIDLGIHGYRVHYCDEAHVYGEMVTNSASAGTQRQRWEQGRFKLIRAASLSLLWLAITRPSRVCLDLACDLLVLPLTYVGLNIAALALLAFLAGFVDPQMANACWVALACLACVAAYSFRGWQLSGTGQDGLLALLWVPVFVAWKLICILTRRGTKDWIRTERERP